MKIIKRIILYSFLILILITTVFIGLGYFEYQKTINNKPLDVAVQELKNKPNYSKIEDISKPMQNAIVAIEDRRFYSHGGVDYYALARSIFVNVTNQGKQGGSTLTQQLAKNFYFMDSNDGYRKISEAFIARKIEKSYSKKDILEMYLNIVYFGDGFYGIYDASVGYFGVEPKDLNIAQASMLAGMPQAPSIYALSNHDPRSFKRQQQVLNSMLELDMITNEQFNEARDLKIYE